MTGFASATADDERGAVAVTIRAVNHRFLDLQVRLPAALADLEPRVRALVQAQVARGRVEFQASLQPRAAAAPDVELNQAFVSALTAALAPATAAGLVQGALTPGDLLRLPQAFSIRERAAEADGSAGWAAAVDGVVGRALTALNEMRSREGAHLGADLAARKRLLAGLLDQVVAAADDGRAQLEARLLERARELSATLPIDQAVLAQEVVRAAQRSDISEEVTRFRAHLDHWDALTDGDEPCGRKLDFLLQEMNREVNTIGSKADGVQVSEHIITLKAELERMKEQVQNVE
ncbi:MAG: YicC/YloC family endoribonuclease [Vicinamibacterales bacterium]